MLLPLLLMLAPASPAQGVIYVDDSATGANDGTSWADAFTDLQDALAIAVPPAQVWVAEGVYRPTTDLDRTRSFEPRAALFGGFAGWEASLAGRAGKVERTILSGDLLGDDGPGFAGYAENSFHVLALYHAPGGLEQVVDGFTVTGGHDEGTWGGGVVAAGVDRFVLRNCRLVANLASSGGGLGVLFSIGRVEECVFLTNEAEHNGGGFNVDIGSNVVLERCWFLGNRAVQGGGGGAYTLSPTLLIDCVFSGNATSGLHGGGGLFAPVPARVVGCTFSANSAVGAGIGAGGLLGKSLPGCAQPDVVDSILWGNVDDSGSGQDAQLRAWGSSDPPVVIASSVQGWVGLPCSRGVLDADPLFLDPLGPDGLAGTSDDVLELGDGSRCLDAGRHARTVPGPYFGLPTPLLDAAGRRRFVDLLQPGDGRVLDLGALERPGPP